MTRRTRTMITTDDDNSLKENIGVNPQGKDVKVKQENAKKGKARRVESDEEDEVQISSQPNSVAETRTDQEAEVDE